MNRLEICIGAARGLQYLHYGTTHRIIHRDFKPSNILLDENWVAKISGFELSKAEMTESGISTRVCGTYGYIDPEYVCDLQLTEKTDVYAFGVVLLDGKFQNEEQRSLVNWLRSCLSWRQIDQLTGPYLIGRIAPDCLMKYLKIALDCLLEKGTKRPTMNTICNTSN